MPKWKRDIPDHFRKLHRAVVTLSFALQGASNKIYAKSKTNRMSRGVFYKLHAYAIVLHNSILSLCDDGWSQVTPALLRAMLDVFANLLVIAEKDSEYRAFKYFYFYNMKVQNDQNIPKKTKEKPRRQMTEGLKELEPTIRARIEKFIKAKKFGTYWFWPDYRSPSDVFRKLTERPSQIILLYGVYSAASHGGHVGSVMFLDQPDQIDTRQRSNPKSAKMAVIASCRHLLEICGLRNEFEELGLTKMYSDLWEIFLSFESAMPPIKSS